MLHDQRAAWPKILIGFFYLCPLAAFVISAVFQLDPEDAPKIFPEMK